MSWRLYIDVGNTNAHWGAFADGRWAAEGRIPSSLLVPESLHAHLEHPLLAVGLRMSAADTVIASSSRPEAVASLSACIGRACGRELRLVGRDIVPDIATDYHDPGAIGTDRLVNAYAARALYGAPCVVLDFGTFLTCEAVLSEGRLVGGAIAAGLPVIGQGIRDLVYRLSHPFEKAIAEAPEAGPGRDTEANLRIGCVGGLAAVGEYLAEQAVSWVGEEARIVATGGDAPLVAPLIKRALTVNLMLALEGLRLIDEQATS